MNGTLSDDCSKVEMVRTLFEDCDVSGDGATSDKPTLNEHFRNYYNLESGGK